MRLTQEAKALTKDTQPVPGRTRSQVRSFPPI